jgi:hypothetical protein
MRKTVCYAYFGDDKFLGWYGDSFGTIVSKTPKLYGYTAEQNDIIKKNFGSKIQELAEKSDLGMLDGRLSPVDRLRDYDSSILSQYTKVELRVVECPCYDGLNPNFDEERHKNWTAYKRKPMYEPCNQHWIYADHELVKTWASETPTTFLETITAE